MSQSIQIAIQHHQAGRLAEAEKIYREILARQPDQADAANLLGMLVAQTGRLDAAVELFRRAVRAKPDFFDAHHNLANALRHLGRLDEAILSYQRAIRIKSDFCRRAQQSWGGAGEGRETGRIDCILSAGYRG